MFRKRVLLICVAALLWIVGCSKISTENYNQLKIGMRYDEVVSLLGKADQCDGAIGLKNCTWGNKDRYIQVSFGGDRVIVFSGHGL